MVRGVGTAVRAPGASTPVGEPHLLREWIRLWALATPNAPAIGGPGGDPLTYAALAAQLDAASGELAACGIGPGARVATIVADGPEAAVLALALMGTGSAAPMNPGYRRHELDFYLADVHPDGIILDEHASPACVEAASRLGLPILRLTTVAGAAAGTFRLSGGGAWPRVAHHAPDPATPALLLHTSGTTSKPKLVPLSHRNVAAATGAIAETLALTPADRCLSVMPLFHIHGLSAIFATLRTGGLAYCPRGFEAPRFFEWYGSFRPTWYTAAPTIHRAILDRAGSQSRLLAEHPLRFIRSASAAMPPQLIAEMEQVLGAPFLEAYGMTEAAPQIASNRLPPAPRKRGSVGRVAGTEMAILDPDGEALPSGTTGEIAVRGPNVMAGYEHNAGANALAFVNGWMRTGDLGYLDTEGDLFITGRLKDVINRGGEKIAPREVEEVLLDHPAVKEVVVFPMADSRLGQDIAAAVVRRPDVAVTDRALKEFVAGRLADFKVPRYVVFLDEMPRGATAKVQRDRMAALIGEARILAAAPTAVGPGISPDPVEAQVAALWADILRLPAVEPTQDFFQLGGDSITGVRLLARVRDAFGVELPLLALFEEAATVGGMAREVSTRRLDATAPALEPITRAGPGEPQPLSFAQEGLWFADQLDPAHPVYNVYRVLRLTGPLREDALHSALNEVVRRHEALRTWFPAVEGRGIRRIAPELWVPLPVVEVPGAPDNAAVERNIERLAIEAAQYPMPVGALPLLRATLLRDGAGGHVLVLVAHHIIADAWSLQILLQEVAALYNDFAAGRAPSLTPLPIQERDFASWQRTLHERAFVKDLPYWREQLSGAPPYLALPFDRPRPRAMSFRGARHPFTILPALVARLRDTSRHESVTPFMTLLAAYAVLLWQRSGQADILMGTPVAGRGRLETEGLIGAFLNTLVFRVDLTGEPTFRDLLGRVRRTVLEGFAHQDMPFNRLVEAMQVARNLGRSPLLHVKFRLQNVPATPLGLTDLDARLMDLDYGFVKGDLGLELLQRGDAIAGFFEYSTDLFDASTIAIMAREFPVLLQRIVDHPDVPLRDFAAPPASLSSSDPDRRAMTTNEGTPGPRSPKGARRQSVSVPTDSLVKTSTLYPGMPFPGLVEPAVAGVDLVEWAAGHQEMVDGLLLTHKLVLFRGFPVKDVAEFERFAKVCTRTLLSYTNRSTPRSKVSGDVYTSTEFPADQSIPMHNEMSYTRSWPMKLWFHCVVPAQTGGETPFADSALVYQRLSPRTREAFAEKGVLYVRNLGGGIDLPWQEVFQTSDRAAVEVFASESGMELEWLPDDRLKTRQRCQGVATHPATGERVFLNQAHLFNIGILSPLVRHELLASYRLADLPRNSYYGDGSEISQETLDEIMRVYETTAIAFPWQAGDIVMLDNMRVAHGRRPFTGPRKIVVAMAEAYSAPDGG